jgi:hypothetical protein
MSISAQELNILSSQSFYDLKNSATDKIYELLRQARLTLIDEVDEKQLLAPEGVDFKKGQLARGESLVGYPYVFLDYPKLYSKMTIFSMRTMVWYGHHLVFSLICAGPLHTAYIQKLESHYPDLSGKNLWVAKNGLWDWEKTDFLELKTDNKTKVISGCSNKDFLKVVRFLPLDMLMDQQAFLDETKRFYQDICPIIQKKM